MSAPSGARLMPDVWMDALGINLWDRIRARGSETPPITKQQLEEWAALIETSTAEELALYDAPL